MLRGLRTELLLLKTPRKKLCLLNDPAWAPRYCLTQNSFTLLALHFPIAKDTNGLHQIFCSRVHTMLGSDHLQLFSKGHRLGVGEGQVPCGASAQPSCRCTCLGQRKRTAWYIYHCPKSLGKPATNTTNAPGAHCCGRSFVSYNSTQPALKTENVAAPGTEEEQTIFQTLLPK